MTALTIFRPSIKAAAMTLRPFAVAAGIIAAGASLPALAHADPAPNDPIAAAMNGAGIGNNGSLSNAIAGFGKSICPALVKPGATMAQLSSQLSGNSGLSPTIAGMVTGMAIQMECPGVMTSLANGQMPFPMPANGQMPFPMQGLGAPAMPSMPFQAPGVNAGPPSLFGMPGR